MSDQKRIKLNIVGDLTLPRGSQGELERLGLSSDGDSFDGELSLFSKSWDISTVSGKSVAVGAPENSWGHLVEQGCRGIVEQGYFDKPGYARRRFWEEKLSNLSNPLEKGVGLEWSLFRDVICFPVFQARTSSPEFQGRLLDRINSHLLQEGINHFGVKLALQRVLDFFQIDSKGKSKKSPVSVSFSHGKNSFYFSLTGRIESDPISQISGGLRKTSNGRYWQGSLLECLLRGADLNLYLFEGGLLEIQVRVSMSVEDRQGEFFLFDLRQGGVPRAPEGAFSYSQLESQSFPAEAFAEGKEVGLEVPSRQVSKEKIEEREEASQKVSGFDGEEEPFLVTVRGDVEEEEEPGFQISGREEREEASQKVSRFSQEKEPFVATVSRESAEGKELEFKRSLKEEGSSPNETHIFHEGAGSAGDFDYRSGLADLEDQKGSRDAEFRGSQLKNQLENEKTRAEESERKKRELEERLNLTKSDLAQLVGEKRNLQKELSSRDLKDKNEENRLKRNIEDLESEIDKRKKELTINKEKLSLVLEQERLEHEKEIERKNRELIEAREQIGELERKSKEIERKTESGPDQEALLESQQLKNDLSRLSRDLEAREKENALKNEELKKVQEKLSQLQTESDEQQVLSPSPIEKQALQKVAELEKELEEKKALNSENRRLKQQVENLEKQNEKQAPVSKREYERLLEKFSDLEKENSSLKEESKESQASTRSLGMGVPVRKTDEELEKELLEASAKIKDLAYQNEFLRELQNEKAEEDKPDEALKGVIGELHGIVEKKEEEILQYQTKIEDIKNSHQEEKLQFEQKIDSLRKEVSEYKEKVRKFELKEREKVREVASSDLRDSGEEQRIRNEKNRLENELSKKDAFIGKIQEKISKMAGDHEKKLEQAREQMDQYRTKIRSLEGELFQTNKTNNAEMEIKKLEHNVDLLNKRILDLTDGPHGISALKNRLSEAEKKVMESRELTRKREAELKARSHEWERNGVKYSQIEEELKKEKSNTLKLEAALAKSSSVERMYEELKKKFQNLQSKVNQAGSQSPGSNTDGASALKLKQTQKILESTKGELDKAKKNVEKLHSDNTKMKSEIVRLKNELIATQKAADKMKKSNQAA